MVSTGDKSVGHRVLVIPVHEITEDTPVAATIADQTSPQADAPAESLAALVSDTETVTPRRSIRKILFSKLSTFATVAVALLALTLIVTKFLGFRAFTVMSGSMEPEYPVGSLIYIKPVDVASLKSGDVISFVANADKTIVTHRIVSVETDPADPTIYRYRTQGDANSAPDANLVHYKNVLGTPILTIPYLGFVAYHLQHPPGIYLVLVLGTLLLAWTFLPQTLEGRRTTARKTVA